MSRDPYHLKGETMTLLHVLMTGTVICFTLAFCLMAAEERSRKR